MPRQIHSSLHLYDPNLSIDMKGYYASTRPDSCLLEKQWVLAQATQFKNDYHLQWAPILVAPGNEEINVPTYLGHRQSPWQIHTKRNWWYGSSSRVPLYRHKALSLNPVQPKTKKIFGAEKVAHWKNVCPACAKFWVQFPNIAKSKKK
jgi:hypothetical protein